MSKVNIIGTNLAADFKRLYCDNDQGMAKNGVLVGGLTDAEYAALRESYGTKMVDSLVTSVSGGQDDYMETHEFAAHNAEPQARQQATKYSLASADDFRFSYVNYATQELASNKPNAPARQTLINQLSVYFSSPGFLNKITETANAAYLDAVVQKLTTLLSNDNEYAQVAALLAKLGEHVLEPMMTICEDRTQSSKLRARALYVAIEMVTSMKTQPFQCAVVYENAFDKNLAVQIDVQSNLDATDWQNAQQKLLGSATKLLPDTIAELIKSKTELMPAFLRTAAKDFASGGNISDETTYVKTFTHLGSIFAAEALCVVLGYPDDSSPSISSVARKSLAALLVTSPDSTMAVLELSARGNDEEVQFNDNGGVGTPQPANLYTELYRVDDYDDRRKRFHAASLASTTELGDTQVLVEAAGWGLENENKITQSIEILSKLATRDGILLGLSADQWAVIERFQNSKLTINGQSVATLAQSVLADRTPR